MKSIAAMILIAGMLLPGIVIGIAFLVLPFREDAKSNWIRTTSRSSLSADGTPQCFMLSTSNRDAWSRRQDEEKRKVFVWRDPEDEEIRAIEAVHGKLRIPIEYDESTKQFHSSCWPVRFDLKCRSISTDCEEPLSLLPAQIAGSDIYVDLPRLSL